MSAGATSTPSQAKPARMTKMSASTSRMGSNAAPESPEGEWFGKEDGVLPLAIQKSLAAAAAKRIPPKDQVLFCVQYSKPTSSQPQGRSESLAPGSSASSRGNSAPPGTEDTKPESAKKASGSAASAQRPEDNNETASSSRGDSARTSAGPSPAISLASLPRNRLAVCEECGVEQKPEMRVLRALLRGAVDEGHNKASIACRARSSSLSALSTFSTPAADTKPSPPNSPGSKASTNGETAAKLRTLLIPFSMGAGLGGGGGDFAPNVAKPTPVPPPKEAVDGASDLVKLRARFVGYIPDAAGRGQKGKAAASSKKTWGSPALSSRGLRKSTTLGEDGKGAKQPVILPYDSCFPGVAVPGASDGAEEGAGAVETTDGAAAAQGRALSPATAAELKSKRRRTTEELSPFVKQEEDASVDEDANADGVRTLRRRNGKARVVSAGSPGPNHTPGTPVGRKRGRVAREDEETEEIRGVDNLSSGSEGEEDALDDYLRRVVVQRCEKEAKRARLADTAMNDEQGGLGYAWQTKENELDFDEGLDVPAEFVEMWVEEAQCLLGYNAKQSETQPLGTGVWLREQQRWEALQKREDRHESLISLLNEAPAPSTEFKKRRRSVRDDEDDHDGEDASAPRRNPFSDPIRRGSPDGPSSEFTISSRIRHHPSDDSRSESETERISRRRSARLQKQTPRNSITPRASRQTERSVRTRRIIDDDDEEEEKEKKERGDESDEEGSGGIAISLDSDDEPTPTLIPPKRGRGRPPKKKITTTHTTERDSAASTPKVGSSDKPTPDPSQVRPRGRGRPPGSRNKKTIAKEEQTSVTPLVIAPITAAVGGRANRSLASTSAPTSACTSVGSLSLPTSVSTSLAASAAPSAPASPRPERLEQESGGATGSTSKPKRGRGRPPKIRRLSTAGPGAAEPMIPIFSPIRFPSSNAWNTHEPIANILDPSQRNAAHPLAASSNENEAVLSAVTEEFPTPLTLNAFMMNEEDLARATLEVRIPYPPVCSADVSTDDLSASSGGFVTAMGSPMET
ncbi:hypothetical protein HDU96_000320 [Phlyctochytrium bullatum]|nr:hypothetical protein HDU96_000320 [Phlyctochytrium bullatum]